MLHPAMPTKAKKVTPTTSAKEQFNVRLDPDVKDRLDAWLGELNEGRRVPLRRSDMVRGILEWAIENRPDWERK